jgi:glycosyltransferase involved in cell wall biosynthesis
VKIIIVSFTFPPQVGGVAEVARTQAVGLTRRGHEVSVVTTLDPRRTDTRAADGIKVRQFDIQGSFQARAGYRGEIDAFQDFIANTSADVILFHCWQNWAVDTALPSFARTRARKIMVSHGYDAHVWKRQARFPWGLGVWLHSLPYVARLPRMMRAFDRIIFLSRRCDTGRFFDGWVARKTCPGRVEVIPNGVHLSEFGKKRENFRKTFDVTTRFMLLDVANYDDRKNQIVTLCDFMATNRDDATLIFIGGEFNEYQKRMAQVHEKLRHTYPKTRVLFLEKIPKDTIYSAYRSADIFLLGAKHETQPLAILDAMAAGVPFISTNAGCVSEFPGGLVKSSGRETTQAIQQMLDDDDLRRKLGAEGRAACETKYDWERVLDAYEKLFEKLVAKKK